MADFVNSIDVLDDDVLMDSILDGSITEFRDNSLTSIQGNRFWGCEKLVTVELPMLTEIPSRLFQDCSVLNVYIPSVTRIWALGFLVAHAMEKLDLPSVTRIGYMAFQYTYHLVALILRADSVCDLENSDAFYRSPIDGFTTFSGAMGYIYVPSALVNSYKSATNWSVYASQFRALEDYTVDGTTTGELDPNKI